MKKGLLTLAGLAFASLASATTITMVPIYEPLSLHGTDVDEVISDTGEALQATVMARPKALTGAFPETLVDSIGTPHKIPTNNPNYKVQEANLLVICRIGLEAELSADGLHVRLDVSKLSIPAEVDLTSRQVLKLAIVAVRKTLEEYQKPQTSGLTVFIEIIGVDEGKATLTDLSARIQLPGGGG
jgi:hypothetical protein